MSGLEILSKDVKFGLVMMINSFDIFWPRFKFLTWLQNTVMPTKKLKIIADIAFSLSEQNDIIPSHHSTDICAMQVLSNIEDTTLLRKAGKHRNDSLSPLRYYLLLEIWAIYLIRQKQIENALRNVWRRRHKLIKKWLAAKEFCTEFKGNMMPLKIICWVHKWVCT